MATIHTVPVATEMDVTVASPFRGPTVSRVLSATIDGGDVIDITREPLAHTLRGERDPYVDRDRLQQSIVIEGARWGDVLIIESAWGRTVGGWSSHLCAAVLGVVDQDGRVVQIGSAGPHGADTRRAERILTELWAGGDSRLALRGEHPAQPSTLIRPEPQRLIDA